MNDEDYKTAKKRSDSACTDDLFISLLLGVLCILAVVENFNDAEWGEFTVSILGALLFVFWFFLRIYHITHPETFSHREIEGK